MHLLTLQMDTHCHTSHIILGIMVDMIGMIRLNNSAVFFFSVLLSTFFLSFA